MVSHGRPEPLNYSRGVHLPEVLLDSALDALLPSKSDGSSPGS